MMLPIIQNKRGRAAKRLLQTLETRFKELRKIGKSMNAEPLKPIEDVPGSKKRKRKIESELEQFIVGFHCNRNLPEGVSFVDGLVIEQ